PFATFGSDSFTWLANDGLDGNVATVTITQDWPKVIASSHGYGSTQAATHDPSHASQDLVIDGDLAYHPTDTFLIRGPGLLQGAEFLGRPATDYSHEVDLAGGGPVSGPTTGSASVGGTVWSDRGLLLGDPQTGESVIFDPLGI